MDELTCKSCGHPIVIPAGVRSHIVVKNNRGVYRIPVLAVRYFRADKGYTKVGYAEEKVYIEETLKSLEKEFDTLFIRIHYGILVAPAYMEGFRVNRVGKNRLTYMFVHMKDDVWLPTSKKYHPRVRQILARVK